MRRFWRVEIARNAAFFLKFCGFAGSESQLLKTGGCGGSAAQDAAKICTPLWRESDLEVNIVKNCYDRSTFLKLNPAKFAPRSGARAVWKSISLKLAGSEDFWKFKSPKFAPRCGARAIRKSTSLKKTERFGRLLEVEAHKICTAVARERLGSQNR